jgi:hypothetical protein
MAAVASCDIAGLLLFVSPIIRLTDEIFVSDMELALNVRKEVHD